MTASTASHLLCTKEAAYRLGTSERTVQRLYRDGRFRNAFRLGPRSPIRIPAEDVEAFKRPPAASNPTND